MISLDWADLPDELLESILQRLPSASDYMRFSIVCQSWYFVAKKNLRKHSAPMLLTYSGEEHIWNLCDMTSQRVLDLQLELPNTRFCGFSKGWLITMDKNFIVSLIDPFSKIMGRRVRRPTTEEDSTITLPPLHPPEMSNERYRTHWTKSKHYEYFLDKAIISADPLSNKKDSIVVVIYSVHGLAYIKLAQDTSWTYVDAEIIPCLKNIVYYKDRLYAIDRRGQVLSCDLSTGQLNITLIVQGGFEPPTRIMTTNGYILEPSDGRGLLMVYRYVKGLRRGRHRSRQSIGRFRGRETIDFKVFKLDIYDHKLVELDSLDDAILFLGDSTISVMASNIPECEPNSIYFIHDHDAMVAQNTLGVSCYDRLRDFGVYDLTDRGFWFFEGEGAAIPIKMSTRTPVWVMANIKL